jgi:phage I-like protein
MWGMDTKSRLVALQEAAIFRTVLDGALAPLTLGEDFAAQGEAVSWHMIALEGKWDGHWMGAFMLTPAMFDQMVHTFESQAIDTVVDYEHSSVFGSSGDGAAPGAGWVTELQHRIAASGESQLWAQIRWTARAAGYIRASEYRYMSPTIQFNATDRKTGKPSGARLHSVALTNVPFLHELPELRLNAMRAALTTKPEEDPMNEQQFKALCAALGLDEKTTPEQLMVKIAALRAEGDNASALATELSTIRKTLALTDDQSISEAVMALNTKAAISADVDVVALQAQVAILTEQSANQTAEQLVEEQQRLGKVGAKETASYTAALTYAKANPEGFAAFMETVKEGSVAPVVDSALSIERVGSPGLNGGNDVTETPEFKAYTASMNLTPEDIAKAKEAGIL